MYIHMDIDKHIFIYLFTHTACVCVPTYMCVCGRHILMLDVRQRRVLHQEHEVPGPQQPLLQQAGRRPQEQRGVVGLQKQHHRPRPLLRRLRQPAPHAQHIFHLVHLRASGWLYYV